jgi:hypothetical protein
MATNAGFLLMAGLGALMFLGRGAGTKTTDEDNRLAMGQVPGGPTPAPFDLQSYIDGLFGDMATVPELPPLKMFYPRNVVVTSSGFPGITKPAPDLITRTTKAGIDSQGDQSIVESSLDILRLQQLTKQRFDAAANVGDPATDTLTRNRVEEMRQMVEAQQLIAAAKSRQAATKAIAALRSRNAQESAARAATSVDDSYQPVIISDGLGLFSSDSTVSTTITAGQDIATYRDDPGPEYYPQPVDFGPIYSESFVISGGMDSPGFASEDEQPYQSVTTVHELSAAYDIGF